ncbi:hypothetical protein ACOMHN_017256 [Nucella lapillus]
MAALVENFCPQNHHDSSNSSPRINNITTTTNSNNSSSEECEETVAVIRVTQFVVLLVYETRILSFLTDSDVSKTSAAASVTSYPQEAPSCLLDGRIRSSLGTDPASVLPTSVFTIHIVSVLCS